MNDLVSRRKAWAINTRSGEGHGFIGLGWFGWPPAEARHLWANRTALFETRREAKAGLASVRKCFPKAAVARVLLTIDTRFSR